MSSVDAQHLSALNFDCDMRLVVLGMLAVVRALGLGIGGFRGDVHIPSCH